MEKSYEEELKDVRWLKRRVDILQERNFMCNMCGGTYNLQIHHKRYIKGYRPWEYRDSDLMCLCENCHQLQHEKRELKLKGDFLLLPLYYNEYFCAYGLPQVDTIFDSTNKFPAQQPYLMVSKRGCTEANIDTYITSKNIARICFARNSGMYYTIFPKPFNADKLGMPRGKETSLIHIWDNDDYDPSYVEFTKLPPFEYDLAVICIDEVGASGWHQGKANELFSNIHVL